VHRDVKPGNLLLDRDGNVHVADFGIATAVGLDSLTQTGTIIGTAGYLSPEQAQGARATPASDVYALGVVAFELLTGERPFQSESTTAEAAAHVHAPIPSLSERNPQLPGELDAIFQMVLAKDPSDRYESCGAFVSELAWVIERTTGSIPVVGPREPAPTVPLRRDGPPPPRRRVPVLPIAAAVLLLLGAAGAVLAALLPDDGDDQARATTFVQTVTAEGRTVRETITTTTEAPPPPQPQPTPPPATQTPPAPPAPSGTSGEALTDQATALLGQGRWEEALSVGQQALAELRGSGKLYEAYANYNVGRALVELDRCEEALPYLNESQRIQGPRSEITQARARCGA
jgi:serine/threonine-protein kinase